MSVFRGEGSAMETLNEIGAPSMLPALIATGCCGKSATPSRRATAATPATPSRCARSRPRSPGAAEEALWGAIVRSSSAKGLLRKLADMAARSAPKTDARRSEAEADEAAQQAQRLHEMVEER
jgi:hypothetical protein